MKKAHTTNQMAIVAMALLVLTTFSNTAQAARVGLFCYLSGNESSLSNDTLLSTRLVLTPTGEALVEVENLTDDIVYINRGNSFAWVNGQAAPMFTPSAQSESHTVVSGSVEHVWHDVSWMSGEAHTSKQTVYDRRILPVAPHGRAVVFAWNDLPRLLRSDIIETNYRGRGSMCKKGRFLTARDGDGASAELLAYPLTKKFRKGDYRNYDAASTPLTLVADIQYSTNDPLQQSANSSGDTEKATSKMRRAKVSDYVETIAVGPYDAISKQGKLLTNYPPMSDGRPCFAFRNGRNASLELGAAAAVGLLVATVVAANNSMPDTKPDWY